MSRHLALFFLCLIQIFFSVVLLAQEQKNSAENIYELDDENLHNRAKLRLYPGGKDEQDLRVQAQLPTYVRKIAPQAKEESAADAPSDD